MMSLPLSFWDRCHPPSAPFPCYPPRRAWPIWVKLKLCQGKGPEVPSEKAVHPWEGTGGLEDQRAHIQGREKGGAGLGGQGQTSAWVQKALRM